MKAPTTLQHPTASSNARIWIRMVLVYLLVPLILLVCAGDLHWWQAWVFTALIMLAGVVPRLLAERRHPGLLAERAKIVDGASAAKPWDRVLAPLMAVSISFPLVIVTGLDHRFGWTAPFPGWLNILGLVLIASGYPFASWALAENRFFSSVVRIQMDRGHEVCDSGPYRIVRHPGYAGNLLPLLGIVLALGSLWTLIPAAVALIIAIVRTEFEDRMLQQELPGYREYAQRVRFRLLPWIY